MAKVPVSVTLRDAPDGSKWNVDAVLEVNVQYLERRDSWTKVKVLDAEGQPVGWIPTGPVGAGISESGQFLRERSESDTIPDWAALSIVLGVVVAVIGFAAAWFTDAGWATLVLAAGLGVAAVGMHAAEAAVNRPKQRPHLSNA
jgi:hypothetical protein